MPGTKRKKPGFASNRRKTTKLTKAYKKVVATKKKSRMRKVVKRHKKRMQNAVPFLRQPKTTMVKFKATMCQTYRMTDRFTTAGDGTNLDQNPVFPGAGIIVNKNNIFDPFNQGFGVQGADCAGFDQFSQQYGKWRVMGAKVTFKVRRLGGTVPISMASGSHLEITSEVVTPAHTTNAASAAAKPSAAQALGGLFDPSTQDPLMLILVDRTAWQDMNSRVQGVTIDTYKEVRQYQHLRGVQWRELKAGAAQKATISSTFSERAMETLNNANNQQLQNTGQFHDDGIQYYDPTANGGVGGMIVNAFKNGVDATLGYITNDYSKGAKAPLTVDHCRLMIKPFDELSQHKHTYGQARILVTCDIEYAVKCSEPRYDYSNPL